MSAASQLPPREEDDLTRRAEEQFQQQRKGKVWLTIGWLVLVADALLWIFVPKDLQAGRHAMLALAVAFGAAGFLMIVTGSRLRPGDE